ncbi:MAG: zinc ribbon domain-containing protein [Bacteroidota bacterium]
MAKKEDTAVQQTVENKLKALFELQDVDSKIDEIQTLRGELPLEVNDLEDEVAGLETRIQKIEAEIQLKNDDISSKKNEITNSQTLIQKYEEQQMDVRNNREFESIAKEIEFQQLEIELSEKRIKEYTFDIQNKTEILNEAQARLEDRKLDLEQKQKELDSIVSETQKEEDELVSESERLAEFIEPRLINAYRRIRTNALNGLAVVSVERDSCGGCFNKIPPQRQLDIKTHRKIIVCEYCGRILIDSELLFQEENPEQETEISEKEVKEQKKAPKTKAKKTKK